MWMLHGSCVSERPACSRSAGGLAASAAVPGAVDSCNITLLLGIQHGLSFLMGEKCFFAVV